jgi:peptidoglycan-associated lipoprotein
MTIRQAARAAATVVLLLVVVGVAGCAKKQPPVARPVPPPPPPPVETPMTPPPEPVAPTGDTGATTTGPVAEDSIAAGSLDEINKNSPLKPVFFGLDAAEVDGDGQRILEQNAETLKRYPTWQISVEGHCDERGTAEYNLALGERRALAARNYLVSLGVSADRVKTVSYGKEFPFDPGHTEAAWSKNRRAHFVVTAK